MGYSKQATNWLGIKINLDFIFNNFHVHRTGLRLVYCLIGENGLS